MDRAWKLLRILQKQRDWWDTSPEERGVAAQTLQEPPASLLAEAQEHLLLPEAHAAFPATQPEGQQALIDSGDSLVLTCKIGKELEAALKEGFGPENATAQEPRSFMSDREILRRTVLTGKTVVTFKDVSLRKVEKTDDGKKKSSVSKQNWEQVMKAAFARYPIGKLENPGTNQARVLFVAIPEDAQTRVQLHNMLVRACQLTVRAWADALAKQLSKPEKRKAKDLENPEDENAPKD